MSFTPGFDPKVAKGLIAIDAQLNGLPVDGLPDPPPPSHFGWGDAPIFDSGVIGPFDNRWQLWKNTEGRLAVAIRGTEAEAGSVIDDVLAVMIPASGTIGYDGEDVDYKLADDPQAAVHLGFTLGAFVLLLDGLNGIVAQLIEQGPGKDVYITGHSQGAAIATIVRSFLEYTNLPFTNSYQTYVFAQPKPGNDHYGYDVEFLTSVKRSGWRLYNTLDWVPQVPLTLEWFSDINEPNPLDAFGKPTKKAKKLLGKTLDDVLKRVSRRRLSKLETQIDGFGEVMKAQTVLPSRPAEGDGVEFPAPLETFNYYSCGNPVSLPGSATEPPPVPGDTFWQHHAGMYYLLLEKYYP